MHRNAMQDLIHARKTKDLLCVKPLTVKQGAVFILLFWFCGGTSLTFFTALLCILAKQTQMLGRFTDDFSGCISSKKFQKGQFGN